MALFMPLSLPEPQVQSSRKHRPDKRRQAEAMTAIFRMKAPGRRKFVTLCINDTPVTLQLDTGFDRTLISKRTRNVIGRPPVEPIKCTVRNASGGSLKLTGKLKFSVTFKGVQLNGTCYLTNYTGLDLLGLDWINELQLLDKPLNAVCDETTANCSDTFTRTSPSDDFVVATVTTKPETRWSIRDAATIQLLASGSGSPLNSVKFDEPCQQPAKFHPRAEPFSLQSTAENKCIVGVYADIPAEAASGYRPLPSITDGDVFDLDLGLVRSWNSSCNWMQAANEFKLPLRLLVCGTLVPASLSTNAKADMTSYHRFAIEREFELIELQPEEDNIEEGEEFGVHRLKSALEAHMWPNMELLDAVNPRRKITTDVMTSTGVKMLNHKSASKTNENSISNSKSPSDSPATAEEEDKESDVELGLDETAESFERMCVRLLKTRDQMSGLGFEERKKLAEKVTMEFWKAVGGSDDELTGEESDDDHLSAKMVSTQPT
ncbi:hypothetical protein T265_09277 [Opisthorchis viverrini]|uniref:Peptidase A2 domain-containing protein n=1 Tax=Opisthorchis viverrini TaxID=6198 RepID=A0A074Z6K2_OPIVI|nr:hypothetical protein T265_09277 [Opisthorchis viverrini]KER22688.1 hypothetical protein T265_09277 [Opisthorchis viverrini]